MEGSERTSCTTERFRFDLVKIRRVVNKKDGELSKDILEESAYSGDIDTRGY